MDWRKFLLSSADGRFRTGWRLVLFFGLAFSALVLVSVAAIAFGYVPDLRDPPSLLVGTFITALPMLLAISVARRVLDRRSLASLGFPRRQMWWDLAAGFFISGVTMGAIFLLFRLAGWLDFDGFIWQTQPPGVWVPGLLVMLLVFVLVGVWEEIFFRGYLFLNLEEGLNTNWALVLSSLIFALFHYNNPGGQSVFPMAGLMLAAIFFGYSFLGTRSLWLPIGLHIGWNFFENAIFGFPVSGLQTPGLLQNTVHGPAAWTGGDFGPEAGLVLLPGLVLAGFLVYAYIRASRAAAA